MRNFVGGSKRERELQALKCVYQLDEFTVAESERPDFKLSRPGGAEFGVEITEIYHSESDARLKRIDSYFSELMDGGRHRHKDDLQALEVKTVQLQPADGSSTRNIQAIMVEMPSLDAYRDILAGAIASKGEKLVDYDAAVSHANLIVVDQIAPLVSGEAEDFSGMVLGPSLRDIVLRSGFSEVFVVTAIAGREVVIPALEVAMITEFKLFLATLERLEIDESRLTDADGLILFHRLLVQRGYDAKLAQYEEGFEVLMGHTGIVIEAERIVVHEHADFPLPGVTSAGDTQAVLEILPLLLGENARVVSEVGLAIDVMRDSLDLGPDSTDPPTERFEQTPRETPRVPRRLDYLEAMVSRSAC